MGKSHLLDEFSKHFFVIPINLRPTDAKGLFITITFRLQDLLNLFYRLSPS
jgi:hypothetical protein